jgi:hypothetical protein
VSLSPNSASFHVPSNRKIRRFTVSSFLVTDQITTSGCEQKTVIAATWFIDADRMVQRKTPGGTQPGLPRRLPKLSGGVMMTRASFPARMSLAMTPVAVRM